MLDLVTRIVSHFKHRSDENKHTSSKCNIPCNNILCSKNNGGTCNVLDMCENIRY